MFDISLIFSMLRASTSLTFATLGGMYSEKAGIVNIALEGLMMFGAFFAGVAAHYTGNPWLGIAAGCLASIIVSLLFGIFCILFESDQIISGMAINILAIGIIPVLSNSFFGTPSITPVINNTIKGFDIPWFPLLADIPILTILSFVLIFASIFVFNKTRFGLRLFSAGENPEALDSSGVSVIKYRFAGLILCGFFTGLGGAFLSISHGTQFILHMTAGRGYIALAALILGNWNPKRILPACLLFGFVDALQIRFQNFNFLPIEIVQILPYVLVILLLMGLGGKPNPPSGLGIPYKLGKK